MKICTRIANSETRKYHSLCDYCTLRDNSCPECETCDISSVQTGGVCKEFIGRFDFPNIGKYKLFDTYTFPLIRDIPYSNPLYFIYLQGFDVNFNGTAVKPTLLKICINKCSNTIVESKKYVLSNLEVSESSFVVFQSALETSNNIFVLLDVRNHSQLPDATYLVAIQKTQENYGGKILLYRMTHNYINTYIRKKLKMLDENMLSLQVNYNHGYLDDIICLVKLNNSSLDNPVDSITEIQSSYGYEYGYGY